MQLTEDQRKSLTDLKNSPWYAVLVMIEERELSRLLKWGMFKDLSKDENIKDLQNQQLYARARSDFLLNIESHLKTMTVPDLPTWYDKTIS